MPSSRAWGNANDDPFDADFDDDDFGAMIAAADMAERRAAGVGSPVVTSTTSEVDFDVEDGDDEFLAAAAEQAELQIAVGESSSDAISTTTASTTSRTEQLAGRSPLTTSNKRPRPAGVEQRPPETLTVLQAVDFDYAGGQRVAKMLGFVEGIRLEIVENPDSDPAARPYFLTMPVSFCDGNDSVKVYLGTSVSKQNCLLRTIDKIV
jgi:hypothetical protein